LLLLQRLSLLSVVQMTDLSLLRKPIFLIPCLANLFGAIGLFIPFVYSTDRAISLGVDPQQAAFLLSVIGGPIGVAICK